MYDLLLPETDGGVIAQAIIFIVVVSLALRLVWHREEWRVFVIGVLVLGISLIGLRGVH